LAVAKPGLVNCASILAADKRMRIAVCIAACLGVYAASRLVADPKLEYGSTLVCEAPAVYCLTASVPGLQAVELR